MSRIDAAPSIDCDHAAVAVLAGEKQARARIVRALATRADLDVRVSASVTEAIACELIVLHWEEIGSEELAALSALKHGAPEALIVVVCASANGRSARRAVDAGVDGLVFANQLAAALEPTVAAVLAGQTVVPRELRATVRKPALSFREKQILGMVVMGFTNSEISARLFLAESTVKSHLSSAFTKLGVRSRNEAASMILDPNGSLGTGILAITSGPQPPAEAAAAAGA